MRLGVIDCGTNTFHLLVAEVNGQGQFTTVHRERRYVRLGQEGLLRIGNAPFLRGVNCLHDFKAKLIDSDVTDYGAYGTEALRRASNGRDFIETVRKTSGVEINLITGDEEARLIHLGVTQAVPDFSGRALIMDIGGGSVEFIIASREEVFWAKSFPIGVQVLYSKYEKQDPISPANIAELEIFLERVLQPLFNILPAHTPQVLFGASGSFEVIEELVIGKRDGNLYSVIDVEDYQRIQQPVIGSTLAERYARTDIPYERAELIVVAFLLVNFILRKTAIRQIVTSAYSMKEGILYEMMRRPLGRVM